MDCSLPGPSVHGIFQARALEWGVVAFSSCLLRGGLYLDHCCTLSMHLAGDHQSFEKCKHLFSLRAAVTY